jgi:superfamily II RNA helicase
VTGREAVEVRSAQRPVPLEFRYATTPLHESVQDLLHENRSPIYLVNFSQRAAAEQAQNLLSIDVCTKEEKQHLKEALLDQQWGTPFGKELKRLLLHGIGLHHAGLLPRYRRVVERLAQQGSLKVISGTDTLGVGVNVPIRTVLFTQLCKFDGEKTVVLPVRDFLQIAGRAGRKGFDDRGYVVAQAPPHVIDNARLQQKKAEGKKVVLQKPPTRGYVHWDHATFERLVSSPPERLESRFSVTHSLLINLLQAYQGSPTSGYRRLVELVLLSHSSVVIKGRLLKHARVLLRSLVGAGVVLQARRTEAEPASLRVAPGLQRDFSLNHTLSLYLLEVLPTLDPAVEGYALQVLSLTESILESPDVILRAQVDKLKGEKVRELKSQGVEYEQRMEELEKVTWPKPHADFIYGTFDEFAARHPWVGQANIRPKSIARELFELGATFNEYVKDYGLQRSEGVLLRYLTDAYRTLLQNVPEGLRTEELEDIGAYLLTVLRRTDSSLVEEWEALRDGRVPGLAAPGAEEPPRARRDLARDLKALAARVRAELHQVVRLLASRAWEELAETLPVEAGWTEETLAAAMAPYFAEHPTLDTTPRARQASLTQLELQEPRVWRVRHALVDSRGEQDWYLEGVVDLRGREDAEGPLVALRLVGH